MQPQKSEKQISLKESDTSKLEAVQNSQQTSNNISMVNQSRISKHYLLQNIKLAGLNKFELAKQHQEKLVMHYSQISLNYQKHFQLIFKNYQKNLQNILQKNYRKIKRK